MRDGARRPTLKAPFPHGSVLSRRLLSVHIRRLPDARGDRSPGVKKHLCYFFLLSSPPRHRGSGGAPHPSTHTRRRLVLPLLRSLFAPAPPAHWHPRQKRTAYSASPLAPSARPHGPDCSSSEKRCVLMLSMRMVHAWKVHACICASPSALWPGKTWPGRGVAKVLDCLPSGSFWTSF